MKTIFKKDFSTNLAQLHRPPSHLHYQGDISLIHTPCLAIVGTRKYSTYAKHATEKLISQLANYRITIVSGLAKGIDTIAHHAALKHNLKTIAVLGSGLNQIYPRENQDLAKQIAQKGLLLSEFEPDQHPTKITFPQRNRIVSGLSLGTLVIQAPQSSGALITARFALDQGRHIFTIPADMDRKDFQGNIELLQKSAAYPIIHAKDIIQELELTKTKNQTQPKIQLNLTPSQLQILNTLSPARGLTAEEISQDSSSPLQETLIQLSLLEIKGFVTIEHGTYLRSF